MLSNRMKQFREYNELEPFCLAELLDISVDEYNSFESGEAIPKIEMIEALAEYYKVTVDEFYGYTPRLFVQTKDTPPIEDDDDTVSLELLKMTDLSWDEKKIVMLYRRNGDKDEIIRQILEGEKK